MLDERSECPGCGADLKYVVGGTTYSHATAVEIMGAYDGALFYAHMPSDGTCGAAWHRWPEGHPLNLRAQSYIDDWNRRQVKS